MKYFSLIEPWLEPQYKLIAQPPPPVSDYDPGDTAQREGMFMVGAEILHRIGKMDDEEYRFVCQRYRNVVDLLNDPNHDGFLRRFPDPLYWGGLSDRLSRDQSVPNVAAMGFVSRPQLDKFFLRHLKFSALLFTNNTRKNWAWPPGDPRYDAKKYKWKLPDLTFGSFHALYIRAYRNWALYPLLLILDLDLLGGAIAKLFYAKDPTNNDDLNHLICQYQSELSMPTPWSKLAKWIYKFRRFPANSGNATNPAQACMNAYFRGGNPGPKLEQVWEEVNKHFMG